MPHLFGNPNAKVGSRGRWRRLAEAGLREPGVPQAEAARDLPIADWLRALASDLHAELGGPGVGALGMCFTGGFALAMMVDDSVAAPVLAQPSLPFPVAARAATSASAPPTSTKDKERAARAARCSGCATRTTWPSATVSTGYRESSATSSSKSSSPAASTPR